MVSLNVFRWAWKAPCWAWLQVNMQSSRFSMHGSIINLYKSRVSLHMAPGWAFTSSSEPPHCKKSWRKTPPAWPDDAVLKYHGDGALFWHADRVNPTSSDDEGGIFRRAMELSYGFCSRRKEFFDNFPSTFRRMKQNRKQQQHWGSNLRSSGLQVTTLPLRHSSFIFCMFASTSFSFVSTLLTIFDNSFPSSVLCPSSIYRVLSRIYYQFH